MGSGQLRLSDFGKIEELAEEMEKHNEITVYGSQFYSRASHGFQAPLKDLEEILKMGWEITECVFHPEGVDGFWPFNTSYLLVCGQYQATFKKCSDTPQKLVGILRVRDEEDVLDEILTEYEKHFDAIYAMAYNEAEYEIIESHIPRGIVKEVHHSLEIPGYERKDSDRQFLLDEIQKDFGTSGFWYFPLQGDEIYEYSPRLHCEIARATRCTHLGTYVATFLLHDPTDRGRAWDPSKSVKDQLSYYIWDYPEFSGVYFKPWMNYKRGVHMRVTPWNLWPNRFLTQRNIRRHYPFRCEEQAKARIATRIGSGFQPHYENYANIFHEVTAAGKEVKKFHGWFGEASDTFAF